MASVFKAARNNAFNMSWAVGTEATPDKELSDNNTLKTLRQRSRQLIKDNFFAAGIQQAILNIIGSLNTIRVENEGGTKLNVKKAQSVINDFIKDCTFDNKTLHDVIEENITSKIADGDVLINLPLDSTRKGIKTVIEVIEANRVKTPINLMRDTNIRHGVKYDKQGRVLGYYVKKFHKVDGNSDRSENFIYLPRVIEVNGIARVVTRLFKAPLSSRPKMSRQYPIITPIINLIKLVDDYLEAVVVGARVAACFAAFVKSMNPAQAYTSFTTDSDGNVEDPSDSATTPRRVHKLFPGMVHYLKPNEDITFASPNRPNDNVDAFIVRMSKLMAMYLRIPYPILFMDVVDVNYSQFRGASNEVKKLRQRWMRGEEDLVDWVFKTVLLEAYTRNMVKGNINQFIIAKRWSSYGILDQEKEARANKLELENGTTSPQRICDEQGTDYNAIQKEREEDRLRQIEARALELKRIKELEEQYDISYAEAEDSPAERETEKRPDEGDELDDEEKKKRRKDDGNF